MAQAVEESGDPAALPAWEVVILGPEGTPYEGGSFHLLVEFPSEYPFKAPLLTLTTEIYHINLVGIQKCRAQRFLPYDKQWGPTLIVQDILSIIRRVMAEPVLPGRGLEGDPEPPRCTAGMRVHVKKPTGQEITVTAGPGDSVRSLKLEIREQEGVPIHECRLIFEYRELENSATLADYGIEPPGEFTVHMVLRCWDLRLADVVDPELGQLFVADRQAFELTAREWTERYAMEEGCTIATVQPSSEDSSITCVGLSGAELLSLQGAPDQKLVRDIRTALARQLGVAPWLVRLVLEDGRLLSPHHDALTVFAAAARAQDSEEPQ